MTIFQEHMIADFAYALQFGGKSVIVDGVQLQVFAGAVTTNAGEFDRQLVATWKIFHLAGDLEDKVPGQLVEVGSERWEVLDHRAAGVSVCLSLFRSLG